MGLQPEDELTCTEMALYENVGRHRLQLACDADPVEGRSYARRLFDRDRLTKLLRRHYDQVVVDWSAEKHADCDRSCPDCLRNYGNRFIHGNLDWRLALDMAGLFLGEPLDTSRWLSNAEPIARRFAALCNANGMEVLVEKAAKLWSVVLPGKLGLVIGHPLWHHREALAQDSQIDAMLEMRGKHGAGTGCRFVDIRELSASPQKFIVELGQAT